MASILVIDDEPAIRKAMNRLLSSLGHIVSEAENGKQGLKVYQSEPAEIVLLDIFMPVKDGLETLGELLLHDPKARVIAITGGGAYKNFDLMEPALLMGASKILHKPIDVLVLQSAIEEALAATA